MSGLERAREAEPGAARSLSGRLADVELVGELVTVRPVRPADAPEAFPLIHRQRPVLDWLVWSGPADVEELRSGYADWIRAFPEGTNYLFAVVDRERGRFRGSIGPRFQGHPELADVGYWLAEEAWGRGYMSEAVGLVTHLCLAHLGARAVVAEVFLGNEASVRVLEKNAFVRAPRTQRRPLPDGSSRTAWSYSRTRRSWARDEGRVRPVRERVELAPDTPGGPPAGRTSESPNP